MFEGLENELILNHFNNSPISSFDQLKQFLETSPIYKTTREILSRNPPNGYEEKENVVNKIDLAENSNFINDALFSVLTTKLKATKPSQIEFIEKIISGFINEKYESSKNFTFLKVPYCYCAGKHDFRVN